MKKMLPRFLIIAIGVFLAMSYKYCFDEDIPCQFNDRDKVDELVYSRHARCRMDCRKFSEDLIEKVYLGGTVNCEKSGPKDGEMRYALEMNDPANGDRLRLIIADDEGDNEHVVVTAIRLDREFECYCD